MGRASRVQRRVARRWLWRARSRSIDSRARSLRRTRHEAAKLLRPLRRQAASRAQRRETGTGVWQLSQRQRLQRPIVDLGDEDPLYTRNSPNGPPDRRRVSLRWLAGSVLTGIFSLVLVGGALQAAIGLDDYIDRPPGARRTAWPSATAPLAEKGDRFRPVPETQGDAARHPDLHRHARRTTATSCACAPSRMSAPISPRRSGRRSRRTRPGLPGRPTSSPPAAKTSRRWTCRRRAIPSTAPRSTARSRSRSVDFPAGRRRLRRDRRSSTSARSRARVREAAPFLADGAVEVASLPYVDPARFDLASADAGRARTRSPSRSRRKTSR